MKNKLLYIAPYCEQEALEPENSVLTTSAVDIDVPDLTEEDF